jgi:hypothetical protein
MYIYRHLFIGMLQYVSQMLNLSAKYPQRVTTDIIRQMCLPDHHRALLVCTMLTHFGCFSTWLYSRPPYGHLRV